jgi:hypothetical protein
MKKIKGVKNGVKLPQKRKRLATGKKSGKK